MFINIYIIKSNIRGDNIMVKNIDKTVDLFLGIAVVFLIVAALYPTSSDAGDELQQSGFPLGSLFVGGGLVFIIIAVFILKKIVASARSGR